ncbi:MAG: aldo/keto reductase [Spirochaetaceae bacterium]|nr:aldo/keto reductase [Spirochaetaceae bacterium]MDT8297666.1 aldo/keto reductase [Spirochaetaceae bacterium]
MKYRNLSNKNIRVSVIGLGTWQLGGEWGQDYTQDEVDAVVDACREEGINLIDTAECYGEGVSERLVGRSVARDRDKWVIATKFGHRYKGIFDRDQLWKADEVRKQLEQSLKNLRTDYIDLYQFHSGGNEYFDNDELWEMLSRQVEAGKIRHIGVSLTSNKAIRDSQVPKVAGVGADAVQVVYNRLDKTAEDTVLPICLKEGLGVLARVPLASGFLTGKYAPGVQFPEGDYRGGLERGKLDTMASEALRIKDQEVPEGVNMAQWALSWCLAHDAVACVIPGARDTAQLRSNTKAADMVSDTHPLAVG